MTDEWIDRVQSVIKNSVSPDTMTPRDMALFMFLMAMCQLDGNDFAAFKKTILEAGGKE